MGFRVWSWQHGGDVLCGKTGPHPPAVVLASSVAAAGAGAGGSNLRYVWRQQRPAGRQTTICSIYIFTLFLSPFFVFIWLTGSTDVLGIQKQAWKAYIIIA